MQLRDLQPGQRFEFVDKKTLLELSEGRKFSPTGAFIYRGVGQRTEPILSNGDFAGEFQIQALSGTYNREVLILL